MYINNRPLPPMIQRAAEGKASKHEKKLVRGYFVHLMMDMSMNQNELHKIVDGLDLG
jgi:hypothetical protein